MIPKPFEQGDKVISIEAPDEYRMTVEACYWGFYPERGETEKDGKWVFRSFEGGEKEWKSGAFRHVTTVDEGLDAEIRMCVRCGCSGDAFEVSRFSHEPQHVRWGDGCIVALKNDLEKLALEVTLTRRESSCSPQLETAWLHADDILTRARRARA